MTALAELVAPPRAGTSLRHEECRNCPVRSLALCGAVGEEAGEALEALVRRKRITRSETLAWQDEPSPVVGIVRKGLVKLTVTDCEGDEQIVGIARAGDFIGRPFGGPLPYGIGAATTAEICVFPRNAFDSLATRFADLGHALLKLTLDELERTRRWLGMLGKKNAGQKLAAFLVEFAATRSEGQVTEVAPTIDMPFRRHQIADVLGMTVETVSRQFTELRKRRIIDLPTSRQIVLRDPDALLVMSGQGTISRH